MGIGGSKEVRIPTPDEQRARLKLAKEEDEKKRRYQEEHSEEIEAKKKLQERNRIALAKIKALNNCVKELNETKEDSVTCHTWDGHEVADYVVHKLRDQGYRVSDPGHSLGIVWHVGLPPTNTDQKMKEVNSD